MLAYVTVIAVTLFCFVGLVVDSGLGSLHYRLAQNAADAAALGAAQAISTGASESDAQSTAQTLASKGGFTASQLSLHFLDASGNATSDASQVATVRSTIQATYPTTFMQVVGEDSVSVKTSAAAGVAQDLPCTLCLLSPSAPNALYGNGNTTINVTTDGAGIAVDSSASNALVLNGVNSTITSSAIGVVGGWSGNGFHPTPTHISPVPDPLAALPEPTMPIQANPQGSQPVLYPGGYQGLSVSGNNTLTLSPGEYYINGPVSISGGGRIVGNGVTLFFGCGYPTQVVACSPGQAGGSLSLSGNGSFDITAPTLAQSEQPGGGIAGLSVFYDRNNSAALTIVGNGDDNFTGTIYAKSAKAEFKGNGETLQTDSLIVVNTATLDGNGTVSLQYTRANNYQRAGIAGMSQ